jgi:hypothetical protein
MNKPDTSDGSRGQLTAGTDTCHLLQIQSPWTWIRETGQTYSFAAFRTYKEWIPVVLRVPSASTRIFLRVVDTDTYQQSASMCVYRATQDGSRGLTFVINHGIRVLVAMMQLEDHMSQPCLTDSEYKIFEFLKLIKKVAPDGSNRTFWSFFHLFCFSAHE